MPIKIYLRNTREIDALPWKWRDEWNCDKQAHGNYFSVPKLEKILSMAQRGGLEWTLLTSDSTLPHRIKTSASSIENQIDPNVSNRIELRWIVASLGNSHRILPCMWRAFSQSKGNFHRMCHAFSQFECWNCLLKINSLPASAIC